PLDDVVVVDHEHTELEPVLTHGASPGTTRRTCQRSPGRGPNSTMPECWTASIVANRRPRPVPGDPGTAPSLTTSSERFPSSTATRTSTRVGRACLSALR